MWEDQRCRSHKHRRFLPTGRGKTVKCDVTEWSLFKLLRTLLEEDPCGYSVCSVSAYSSCFLPAGSCSTLGETARLHFVPIFKVKHVLHQIQQCSSVFGLDSLVCWASFYGPFFSSTSLISFHKMGIRLQISTQVLQWYTVYCLIKSHLERHEFSGGLT